MCPSQMTSTTTTTKTAKVTFSNKDSRAQSKLLQEAVANKQKEKNHQFRTKKNEDSHDFIMSSLSTWMERIKTSCQTSSSAASSSSSSSSNINNALAESATSLDYASTTTNNNNSSEFFATTTNNNNNNENINNCLNDLNRVYQHMPNEWKEVLLHEDQQAEETSESSTTHHEEDHLAEEFLIRDAAAYPRASEMLDPKEMIGLVL